MIARKGNEGLHGDARNDMLLNKVEKNLPLEWKVTGNDVSIPRR